MSTPLTFHTIHAHLQHSPAPLLPPKRPLHANLTSQIASLQLHPTLEAALHILNQDLPSAHFLVRHMQAAPAFEGMFLHGILHRIEGDYDNARAWYSDVRGEEVYRAVWGSEGVGWKEWKENGRTGEKDGGQVFIDDIERFRRGKVGEKVGGGKGLGDEQAVGSGRGRGKHELERESAREIDTIVKRCVELFGTERMQDASEAWVRPSENIRRMGQDQVHGSSGRREF